MAPIHIAIDAMGGDHGPKVTVPAALDALTEHQNLHVSLVGDTKILNQYKSSFANYGERLSLVHTEEQVEMDESPASALRFKKNSSMRLAINMVKSGEAHACVSAGNTGALMATAKFVLKTVPGISRPAIVFSIPTYGPDGPARIRMLDLGANVDCTPEQLFEFAIMGHVLARSVDAIEKPRVGLLNIGSEAIKGCESVKAASRLLEGAQGIDYIGYVEGTDIYRHVSDVVVCDGFVGNVALKSSEGVAQMMMKVIKKGFHRNLLTKACGAVCAPLLKSILKDIDPKRYNGATFVGLNGVVIKSHGNAPTESFKVAIDEAMCEVKHNIPELIRTEAASYLHERISA